MTGGGEDERDALLASLRSSEKTVHRLERFLTELGLGSSARASEREEEEEVGRVEVLEERCRLMQVF